MFHRRQSHPRSDGITFVQRNITFFTIVAKLTTLPFTRGQTTNSTLGPLTDTCQAMVYDSEHRSCPRNAPSDSRIIASTTPNRQTDSVSNEQPDLIGSTLEHLANRLLPASAQEKTTQFERNLKNLLFFAKKDVTFLVFWLTYIC